VHCHGKGLKKEWEPRSKEGTPDQGGWGLNESTGSGTRKITLGTR